MCYNLALLFFFLLVFSYRLAPNYVRRKKNRQVYIYISNVLDMYNLH